MNFTYDELRFLIEKSMEARFSHLGMLYDTEKGEGFFEGDSEHFKQIVSYQTERISFYDALLSKLYIMIDQVEAPTLPVQEDKQ